LTSTSLFTWQNRDQAGYDLLQLVYHAPPFIRNRSAKLLRAIRAPGIIPELITLTLNTQDDVWLRIYAMRAIASADGDIYMPELRPLMENKNLLSNVLYIAEAHPCNREWFFTTLYEIFAAPDIIKFLSGFMFVFMTDEFRQELISRLCNLLEVQPDLLTLKLVDALYYYQAEAWLDAHFDRVLELCNLEVTNSKVFRLAQKWDKLRESLLNFDSFGELWQQHIHHSPNLTASDKWDFLQAPVYLHLEQTYQNALNGDKTAFGRLVRIAQTWNGNIAVRGVATHFISQLHQQYDIHPTLDMLMHYSHDNWGGEPYDSPIRYEAGVGLTRIPTPATWITLVDSFFIEPQNILSSFQIAWVKYVTNHLSDDVSEYNDIKYGTNERRSWFRSLKDLSLDALPR
jgi:hypothetical protein